MARGIFLDPCQGNSAVKSMGAQPKRCSNSPRLSRLILQKLTTLTISFQLTADS